MCVCEGVRAYERTHRNAVYKNMLKHVSVLSVPCVCGVGVCACVSLSVRVCVCVCVHECVHVDHTCMCVYVRAGADDRMCMLVCVHVCVCMHSPSAILVQRIYSNIHTYTFIHMNLCMYTNVHRRQS